MIYVRLVTENLEKMYSPDDATVFTHDAASNIRRRAFEQWPSCDWQMVKLATDRYRVSSETDFIDEFRG
jgi:hypothetical protein